MKTMAPNYFKHFRCIADRCRHSCCIGWEIDIDEDSLEFYKTIGGELGTKLASHIVTEEDCAHFRLIGKEERCPFLQENGLCEMILTLGEDSLCSICREHPRFYHCFSDRDEIGLGLCCEEAARIILSQEENTFMETLDDDGDHEEPTAWEKRLLALRETLFSLLQNKEKNIHERAKEILAASGAQIPSKTPDAWCELLLSLEQLDPAWSKTLETLRGTDCKMLTALEKPLEKLLWYFIYRHTAEAADEENFSARVAFAYLGYHIIHLLCSAKLERDGTCDFHDLAEFSRHYSSEIEYSEENTQILLHILRDPKTP